MTRRKSADARYFRAKQRDATTARLTKLVVAAVPGARVSDNNDSYLLHLPGQALALGFWDARTCERAIRRLVQATNNGTDANEIREKC